MLDFSKRSRRSIVVFTVVFLVIVLGPRVYFHLKSPEKISITQEMMKLSDEERLQKEYELNNFRSSKSSVNRENRFKKPEKRFDPNQYTIQQWMKLGLTEKQASVILKFNKYGFYSVEDMQRCFIFQNEDFLNLIEDSLVFPKRKPRVERGKLHDNFQGSKNESSNLYIDINTASPEELERLSGIGEYFANKIVDFRKKLGGFYDIHQLLDIYRFDKNVFLKIESQIYIGNAGIQKININTATVEQLKSHPYIRTWNLANSIVKIRMQKNGYKKVAEIKQSVLMNDSIYRKIEPYLIIE